jgi:hypothetical protein
MVVSGVQVGEIAVLVNPARAARAAVVPGRVEHEVIDDQLAPPLEEVEQARLAVGALEDVVLFDLDHRQPPTLGVQRVPRPGGRLLLGEQLLASDQPLVS